FGRCYFRGLGHSRFSMRGGELQGNNVQIFERLALLVRDYGSYFGQRRGFAPRRWPAPLRWRWLRRSPDRS
ncbi:MAG TPA: hypothetical protein VF742_12610, partial [Terracidiphilus sp.]